MNKTALVSGASRGIGRAVAVALARDGYQVACVYASNSAEAEHTLELIRQTGGIARCYPCDVSDYEKTEALVKAVTAEMGPIAALVNNAGITNDKLIARMSENDFCRVVNVNLNGAFNLIRHTAPGFMRARAGRIVNITSVAGIIGNAGQANYAAAKAGLIGLTKSVAKELAPRGITCNAVAPGMIDTDMTTSLTDGQRQQLLGAIPLGRGGLAGEVADLVAFLVSGKAAYITGTVIPVDGGLAM